jgi:uncharacterized membrane protein
MADAPTIDSDDVTALDETVTHDTTDTDTTETDADDPTAADGRAGNGKVPWRVSLFRRPTWGALAFALLFWWESLSPTLMPRTAVSQAAVSAVCIGAALVIGTFVGWCFHHLLARFGKQVPGSVRRIAWMALAGIAVAVLAAGLIVWTPWQNDHRDLMSMEHLSATTLLPLVLLTIVLTAFLMLLGRVIWRGIRAVNRWINRLLPHTAATWLTIIVVVLGVRWVATNAFEGFDNWARNQFGEVDNGTEDGVEQPQDPTVSGSPDSLIPWDTLGSQGRTFVARATPATDLQAFADGNPEAPPVQRPIRIYAGLQSADDAEGRADLAVKDLERAGGFDRSILVVTTVTGTGWVDPDAARAIEMMYGGDTAMIAIQYSFLPSWISTLVDSDVAQAAGSELFNAVAERWNELPVDSRPKLVVFGQSLGSLGAEAAFVGHDVRSSVANMESRTQGILYTGPTNGNRIWQQLVAARDAGSTSWLPVYRGGEHVRFANRIDELVPAPTDWNGTRILYIQHPSDPVTFWSFDTIAKEPEWIQDPTGYDVPDRAHWFPFVTWAAGVADLSAGFGAAPGYGHDYSTAFVAGWAAVSPPDGWSDDETLRLQDFLHKG